MRRRSPEGYTRGSWICTSSVPWRPPPSVRPWTPSSARRPRAGPAGRAIRRTDGHVARGGHDARSRRDLLLPALHALQDRVGRISQPGLNYVCKRLSVPPAEAYGVATFYSLLATAPRPPAVAHVCDDIACRLAGAESVCDDLERIARAGRGTGPRRHDDLAPEPLPRTLRAGARGPDHRRRRDARSARSSRRSMRPGS